MVIGGGWGTAAAQTAGNRPGFLPEVKIGVLANQGSNRCLKMWGATADYLSAHVPGHRFKIVPLGYANVEPAVAARQVDFLFVNSAQYVALENQYQISRIATLKNKVDGAVVSRYGSVVFYRPDRRDINSLNDLRGKSFMAPELDSFGGWEMTLRDLRQKGMDPEHDFSSIHFAGSQDAVVRAVLRGEADAGAVRTGILEAMVAAKKIRRDDFRKFSTYDGPRSAEAPRLISTRSYPEWPMARLQHTSLALAEQVAEALRKMPPDAPAARQAGIAGWTYPADYQEVRACLEELQIGPFCRSVTLAATLRAYWPWLLAALLAAIVLAVTTAMFASMNRRLAVAQKAAYADISERKRNEEELRRAKEYAEETAARLRTLTSAVEQSPASVVITNLQGCIEYVNPGFAQTTGYTPEEAIGANPRILQSGLHPCAFYEKMWKTIVRGAVRRGEICNRKKNGEILWEDATIAPVSDTDGVLTHFVAVKIDVTQRKRADEALTLAKEQAEEASRAKSQFLASMSHELRTPLNGVIGMAELLGNTELDQRQRSFVDACRSSGKSLLALINDILDFSKIEAGKLELDEHDFHLGRLVEEIVETMAFQAHQKKIQIFSHVAPRACRTLRGDSGRLRQILVNLIGNAIKFTAAGEVTVRVEPAETADDPALFRFRVSDTGIGIPADRMERLFQSFSQADSSTTRKYGGSGLGLAISKALVQLMGGQIGVQSESGRGSTFWFSVPLQDAAGEEGGFSTFSTELESAEPLPPKPGPAPGSVLANARVLLAEDNPISRRVAEEILRQAGMTCRAVDNGRQALEAVAGERFDLVLMDCQMPEMDGFTATQRIREMEDNGQLAGRLPVIALTANAIKGDRERCLAAGMDDYISKPFEVQALLATLARFLAGPSRTAADAPAAGPPSVPPGSDSPAPIDRDTLLDLCTGSPEFVRSVLSEFAEDLPQRFERLAGHVRQGDARAACEVAHSLKGSAGMLAAGAVQELAAQVEAAGRAGGLAEMAALLNLLGDEIHRCLDYIPELQAAMDSLPALADPASAAR